MLKNILASLLLVALAFSVQAQQPSDTNKPIERNLYARHVVNGEEKDIAKVWVYQPEKSVSTGQAVIVCPGGAYKFLSMDSEGHMVAEWLRGLGVTAIVLKYTMPNGDPMRPIGDMRTAIRLVHDSATVWGVDETKIGVMGFSAGGHLASTAATHFGDKDIPAFAILIYPVITMNEQYTHALSRSCLIGDRYYNKPMVDLYSNEKQVSASTPPTFIALSDDDLSVVPENSMLFYRAMKKFGRPVEMHVYPTGGHGWGFKYPFAYKDEMLSSLSRWLKGQGAK